MSNSTSDYQVDTVDADALMGFFQQFSLSYQDIEQSLLMLELDATDMDVIDELVTAIHAIQQALHKIEFNELEKLINSLLVLLQSIRNQVLQFETVISDIILLVVDDIKTVLEKIIDGSERCVILERVPKVCKALEQIPNTDALHRDGVIKDVLMMLDPSTEIMEQSELASDYLARLFEDSGPDHEELAAYGVEENEDFVFFRGLSAPLETRAHYWLGRSQRMLRLALKMNDMADRPVDPTQLAAAIYMHDAGMALIPLSVINSKGSLSEQDRAKMEQHPQIGYELLRYMKDWSEASLMVLQHHERMDGSGYPQGLKENEICDGAKIIAIADAMDARTHERAHATLMKRPLLRAAMEISKKADTQFSSYWVDIFSSVFHEMRQQENSHVDEA